MPCDGNCLFHSLGYPETSHDAVRRYCFRHIERNWNYYKEFVNDDERPTYMRSMRQNGTWGDELILSAFAAVTGTGILVFCADTNRLIQQYGNPRQRRHLQFNGSHYNVLLPIKKNDR